MNKLPPDKKISVRKPKDFRTKPKRCSFRFRRILPILIKLQHIETYSPDKALEIITYISEKNTVQFLSPVEKDVLRNYLYKWGYDYSWVK